MNLKNKTALIVCGTSPLGVDLIRKFALSGATVTATARASGRSALDVLETAVSIVDLDLENPLSIDACIRQVTSGTKFDFVIFVCGYLLGQPLEQYDDKEIATTFAINAVSQISLLRGMLGHINDRGAVLFVSSIAATAGSYDPVYAAAKAAQIGLMKSMAKYHGHRVRFNVVAPGTISDSPMAASFSDETLQRHIEETPTGRLNCSEDLAGIIVSICGEEWLNLNGQVIAINGGRYV